MIHILVFIIIIIIDKLMMFYVRTYKNFNSVHLTNDTNTIRGRT